MPKKILKGKVVSEKMNNTVVVSVDTSKRHPFYKKLVKRNKKFKARDDLGVKLGSLVTIEESRPYGKKVTWKVISEEKE